MSATQELIAAALTAAEVFELSARFEDEKNAVEALRELCARAMVQPAAPDIAEVRPGMEGWKEATIAWEVCASIHREYAKKKDPFFTTRQSDFVKHAEAARAKALTPEPDMAERDDLIADNERLMQIAAQEVSAAEVPMPQGYAERPSDYTGGIWIESQMRQYGDTRESAGYARGKAENAKDAERYRWLRDGNDRKESAAMRIALHCYGMEWDAAIDAALRGEVK